MPRFKVKIECEIISDEEGATVEESAEDVRRTVTDIVDDELRSWSEDDAVDISVVAVE